MGKLIVVCIIYLLFGIPSIVCAQKINIYSEVLPPFQIVNKKNHDVSGSATEKVKKIMAAANIEAEFNIVPWARAFNTVKEKENTLIYSMHRSPEREPFFHWLAVVAQIKNGLVTLKKQHIKINSLEEAKTYVIAVSLDSYPYNYLKSKGFSEDKNLVVVTSRDTELNLFLSGKVDFLFADLAFISEKLKTRNLSSELVEQAYSQPDWTSDLYLAINKNSDELLIQKIKKAITIVEQTPPFK
ncbi:substrate-binding periplasmic protein [Thalassotalea piscium]